MYTCMEETTEPTHEYIIMYVHVCRRPCTYVRTYVHVVLSSTFFCGIVQGTGLIVHCGTE